MTDEEKKDYIQELIYDLNDPQCAILDKDKLEYAVMKALEKGLAKENAEMKEALKNHPETASVTQLMELIQVRQENEKLKAREKALGKRVLQLQKDKGKLIDENKKMRCCGNCKHSMLTEDNIIECCEECEVNTYICDKWELAE